MTKEKFNIDTLIEIVTRGGTVKTGVDIFNTKNILLLEKDVPVNDVHILLHIKENGIADIPINPDYAGGMWDKNGKEIPLKPKRNEPSEKTNPIEFSTVENRIREINDLKIQASEKYNNAKGSIKKVIQDIMSTGGEFDYAVVEETVIDLFNFITENRNAFSYLTKEIFSYDDYLYNHSINVCTIGTAILKVFNDEFGNTINKYLESFSFVSLNDDDDDESDVSFIYYFPDELYEMSLGFFLHDIGKVMIPDAIINKKGKLSKEEFNMVMKHSFEKGIELLQKNRITSPFVNNIVKYHHGNLFRYEPRCYPKDKRHFEIPSYVSVCKLADIYDAMTSRRCYKEAFSPTGVVTDIFHQYAEKDRMLQFILHSFVKAIGIYPPGSIVLLLNKQMAYILDSEGPLIIIFTDSSGNPLRSKQNPINLGDKNSETAGLKIDRRQAPSSPKECYDILPTYLKEMCF